MNDLLYQYEVIINSLLIVEYVKIYTSSVKNNHIYN